jgi:hypothetical protein
MPPDAQVKIEDRVITEFGKYMSDVVSNPYAFGMYGSRLCLKSKSIISKCPQDFLRMNGNVVHVRFDGGEDDNFVQISRNGRNGLAFVVDRSYNDLGRVLGFSLVNFIKGHGSDFSVYLASSELCKGSGHNGDGGGESVNNLFLYVINQKNNRSLSVEDYYALENRNVNNVFTVNDIITDVGKYIAGLKNNAVDKKTLQDIVRKDEEKRGIIFKEGLKNLKDGELALEVEDAGFKVWYPGPAGINAQWDHKYFHHDYEKDPIQNVESFRRLFEETAYIVLKKAGDKRIKLEIIAKLVENKQKFDLIHPPQLY